MYKFKLEKSIQGGYVNTSDDEFLQLGQLAYEHELSGREITGICKTVKRNSFRWDRAGAMLDARQGDIQTQLAIKNQLYLPFGFKELETETIRLINDKMQGKMNSDKYFEE